MGEGALKDEDGLDSGEMVGEVERGGDEMGWCQSAGIGAHCKWKKTWLGGSMARRFGV